MELREPPTTFGQLDKSFLGLWLNADVLVRSPDAARALPLFFSSLHSPRDDSHRAFVADARPGEARGLAAGTMTTATHESRHFHDLLFTTYGAMIARQHIRAALLIQQAYDDLYLRSRMIVVPLDAWNGYWKTLRVAYPDVEAPPESLRQLGEALALMRTKLSTFNSGVICPPALKLDATSILESIAANVQARTIMGEFGRATADDFLNVFRTTGAYDRYFRAATLVETALGPMPMEAMLLLLEASLCGDFQDPRPDVPRYPADLLIAIIHWLDQRHLRPGRLATFDDLYEAVDQFFEHTFGDDLQGVVTRAAKLNWEEAVPRFHEMARDIGKLRPSGDEPAATAAADAFESYSRTSGALIANICAEPSWYCAQHYDRVWAHLPRPLVVVATQFGLPITPDLEYSFQIHTHVSFGIKNQATENWGPLPAELLDRFPDAAGKFATAITLRPELVYALQQKKPELPIAHPFEMPPLDLRAWMHYYEGSTALLRLLTEEEDQALSGIDQQLTLYAFALVGTKVYGLGGPLPMPAAADATAAALWDPYLHAKYKDAGFLTALEDLRAMKGQPSPTGT